MDDTSKSRWEGGWQENAISDLENTTLSLSAIGAKYGRNKATIYKMMKNSGIVRPEEKARSGPTPVAGIKPISPQHRAVGIRLTIHRGGRTFTEVGDELNLSRHMVKRMELGIWDFSLSQLIDVSGLLQMPIEKMLEPHKI